MIEFGRSKKLMPGVSRENMKVLDQISKETRDAVMAEMKRTLVFDSTDYSTINHIRNLLDSKLLSKEKRTQLKIMEKTMQPHMAQTIDAAVEREWDKALSEKINKAVKSGRLSAPSKEAMAAWQHKL